MYEMTYNVSIGMLNTTVTYLLILQVHPGHRVTQAPLVRREQQVPAAPLELRERLVLKAEQDHKDLPLLRDCLDFLVLRDQLAPLELQVNL